MSICAQEVILNANEPNNNEIGAWSIITGNGLIEDPNNPNTTITNLSFGENILQWTISDQCESTSSDIIIQVEITDVLISNTSDYNGENISCNTASDGFVELTATGGYPPYNYNWSGPNNFTSSNQDIDSLSPGLYQCIITDFMGCQNTISIIIEEPNPIEINLIDVSDLNCFDDAYININLEGGTGTLEGVINTSWGENTTFLADDGEEWYIEDADFDQWDGEISITITDANNCTMSLDNINISTWDNPIADFTISTFNTGVLENIYFSDYSTSESPIINWSWDFGDNNIQIIKILAICMIMRGNIPYV